MTAPLWPLEEPSHDWLGSWEGGSEPQIMAGIQQKSFLLRHSRVIRILKFGMSWLEKSRSMPWDISQDTHGPRTRTIKRRESSERGREGENKTRAR